MHTSKSLDFISGMGKKLVRSQNEVAANQNCNVRLYFLEIKEICIYIVSKHGHLGVHIGQWRTHELV